MRERTWNGPHGSLGYRERDGEGVPVVALHGFTGSSRDMLALADSVPRARWLAPDLPGHGASRFDPESPAFRAHGVAALLLEWLDALAIDRAHFVGYSMGGRVALQTSVRAPERIASLALISASAGIEDEDERAARRSADDGIAARLESGDDRTFLRFWLTQPLLAHFAARGSDALEREIERRVPLDRPGLAASLRRFGSGTMPALWPELGRIAAPALVLTGSDDAAYQRYGVRLASLMPNARARTIAGPHALVLANPKAVAEELAAFYADVT